MYLYEYRACGRISAERYEKLSLKYEDEQENIKTALEALKSEMDKTKLKEKYVTDFINKAKEYTDITQITPQILKQLIQKIYVFEKEHKYSHIDGNVILIIYTFEMPNDISKHDLVFK
ncbi:DUF4368 domain-containing protein [Lachnospiraceae bacterium NSJ-143]|nr:DUF4368 domain-containing protein [Lachnospiraceae bacterium NSJ-143]